MARGEWQPPTLTYTPGRNNVRPEDEVEPFYVPGCWIEAFDPARETEEFDRMVSGAGEPERCLETEELNRIYNLPANTGGDI